MIDGERDERKKERKRERERNKQERERERKERVSENETISRLLFQEKERDRERCAKTVLSPCSMIGTFTTSVVERVKRMRFETKENKL